MRADRRFAAGLVGERGAALLVAIVLMLVIGAIGAALALASRTETLVADGFRQTRDLLYVAEGAVALAVRDLDAFAALTTALSGATPSSFTDGAAIGAKTLPAGTSVVLCCGPGSVTAEVQQRAHAGRDWGANTPQWRMFAWGRAHDWLPAGRIDSAAYVAVWIADDPADGDGNPAADANGIVELYAQALGWAGGRRVVHASVGRTTAGGGAPVPGLRVLSWREMRW